MEKIVTFLKNLIDGNGPDYIWNEPYEVYRRAMGSGIYADDARLLLFVLTCGTELRSFIISAAGDVDAISKELKRMCHLTKDVTDRFAGVITSLYSEVNQTGWKDKQESGFRNFCKKKWNFEWKGYARWKADYVYVDSIASAVVTVKVVDREKVGDAVAGMLAENPFATDKEIFEYFENELCNILSEDFKYYCQNDEYYPPIAEDYEGNCEEEIEKFCEATGMKPIDLTFFGESGDYEHY